MDLKKYLEDMISTANFQPSNLVGTRTPSGDVASPSRGPQKAKKGRIKLKKAAKVNSLGMQKRPTMFRIQPATWDVGTPSKEELGGGHIV